MRTVEKGSKADKVVKNATITVAYSFVRGPFSSILLPLQYFSDIHPDQIAVSLDKTQTLSKQLKTIEDQTQTDLRPMLQTRLLPTSLAARNGAAYRL